jgi:hypothetical protein
MLFIVLMTGLFLAGCAQQEAPDTTSETPAQQALVVKVEAPEALEVPAAMEPKSDTDWEAITNNKNIEIIQVVNIINPVAAYIIAAFDQYGDKLGSFTHEEWEDTQAQLGKASTIYEDCKKRMAAGDHDKQLFLDLEEAWQVFVKVGVAGVRTKSMIDADLEKAGR